MKNKIFHIAGSCGLSPAAFFENTEIKEHYFLRKNLKFLNKAHEKDFQIAVTNGTSNENKLGLEYKQKFWVFLAIYFSITILYLISYILSYIYEKSSGQALGLQLGLMGGQLLINSILYFLTFYMRLFYRIHSELFKLSYFIAAFSLILSSEPSAEMIFDYNGKNYLTCLLGLIVLLHSSQLVLFTNFFSYFVIHIPIALFYLGIHLGTDQETSETLLEFFFYIVLIIIESKTFYYNEMSARQQYVLQSHVITDKKEEFARKEDVNSSQSEIENVMNYLTETMLISDELTSATAGADNKDKILKVKDLCSKAIKVIKTRNNIDFTDVETITKGLDEEDRLFVKEILSKSIQLKIRSKLRIRNTNELALNYIAYDVEELLGVLRQIGKNWNFDMFFLKGCTRDRPLTTVGKYCMTKFRLDEALNLDEEIYSNYFDELERRYKPNPYHNSTHAADVLSSMLYFINKSNLCSLLSEYDILASIISALGHDVGHPGYSNRFLMVNKDDVAITCKCYLDNDSSVLEMMHCAITFQVMKTDKANILMTLDSDHYSAVRRLTIDMILATDMSKHWDLLAQFKAKTTTIPNQFDSIDQRSDILKMLMKAADVGHAAKSVDLHHKWTNLIVQEFFNQGDLEKQKGQTVSMYCDRETTNTAKSQAGFIKNLVLPMYEAICTYLKSPLFEENCLEQLKNNLHCWEYEMTRNKIRTQDFDGSYKENDKLVGNSRRDRRSGTQRVSADPEITSWHVIDN